MCTHADLLIGSGGITTPFPCCSSQALEQSLKNKLPIPHPEYLHLLDHLWKNLRGFSFHHPGATGFRSGFQEGQSPGKPAWSFLLCRETAQVSTHHWPCLPDRQTPHRGCFALILTTRKTSPANLAPLWGQGHWLCSGQVCTEAGWHLAPCLCPWAAVDCEPLFHCANVLFSLHGSDLGTSDVPVTGWFICPKTLQSAHHNVHLLWQLIYPTLAKMSMNYLACARIPLALLTFHQRLGCLIKQSIVENEKSKQTVGVITKKMWDQMVQHLSSRLVILATIIKMDWD